MRLKPALTLLCAATLAVVASSALARQPIVKEPGGGGRGGAGGVASPGGGNQDACGVVLCLAGAAMNGQLPTACTGYVEKYFAIQAFHNGDFSPSRTAKARMNFLNQCQGSDAQSKNSVNNRYGGQMGL